MKNHTIKVNNFDNHLLITVTDMSNLIDHIPAMVYRAVLTDQGIVLIKDRKNFTLPTLRFGNHKNYVKQITSTYSRDGLNNGVLAVGAKGSGKSMLAEEIGNWLINQDVPVILVDEPMSSQKLSLIIRAVGPCMVYFDEFGKVFDDDDKRQALLPLFSDTSFTGVMFIATGNDADEFSDYLWNRPQRFRYCINYEGGIGFDVLDDVLKTMQVAPELHAAFHLYLRSEHSALNMDALLCVVRESAGFTDVNALATHLEILNVPSFPRTLWNISKVEILDAGDADENGVGYDIYHDRDYNTLSLRESVRVGHRGKGDDSDLLSKIVPLVYPINHESFSVVIKCHRTIRVTLSFDLGNHTVDTGLKGHGTAEDNNPDKDSDALAYGRMVMSSSPLSKYMQ
jgi:hypothetical protein